MSTQSWSCGLTLLPSASTLTAAELKGYTDSLRAAFTTWWSFTSGVGKNNQPDCVFTGLNSYFYIASQSTAVSQSSSDFVSSLPGTATTVMMPTQISLAVTLLTVQPGRHGKGRIYLPMTGGQMTSPHRVDPSVQQNIVTSTAALFTTINSTSLGAGTGLLAVGAFQAFPPLISAIRVDSEYDIQRRRADQITAGQFISATI